MCAFYILHLHIIIHLPILDLHISTSYICASYIFASYICTSYIFTSYICTSYIFTSCICTFYTCTSSLMHIFPLQIIHLNILHLRLLHLQIIHLNILQFLYPLCLSTSLSLFLPLGLLHTVSLCLFFLVSLSLLHPPNFIFTPEASRWCHRIWMLGSFSDTCWGCMRTA